MRKHMRDPERKVSWVATLYISFFLGWLGVDRFVMGKIPTGILKGITLGGLGIWWLIDLVLIMSSYKFKNVRWKEPKNKKVHIAVVLGLWILLFVLGRSDTGNVDTEATETQEEQKPPPVQEPTIVDDNFAQFATNFWGSTDLQREEMWKQLEGKYVKWSFYVTDVDKDVFGRYTVLGSITKPGKYDIGSDLVVRFPESERDSLLKYSEGDVMTIIGALDSYSGLLTTLDVTQAQLTDTEPIQYASRGEYSEECQRVTTACNQGDTNSCLIEYQLQNQGLC